MESSERGFTLIELTVVLCVMAILATIALPTMFNKNKLEDELRLERHKHEYKVALRKYYIDFGEKVSTASEPRPNQWTGGTPTNASWKGKLINYGIKPIVGYKYKYTAAGYFGSIEVTK